MIHRCVWLIHAWCRRIRIRPCLSSKSNSLLPRWSAPRRWSKDLRFENFVSGVQTPAFAIWSGSINRYASACWGLHGTPQAPKGIRRKFHSHTAGFAEGAGTGKACKLQHLKNCSIDGELIQTSLKEIDAKNRFKVGVRNLIQISNERIDKVRSPRETIRNLCLPMQKLLGAAALKSVLGGQVMEDAALIPVEERIHIETLRLLIENAKLRKILNDYSEGILRNCLAKVDRRKYAEFILFLVLSCHWFQSKSAGSRTDSAKGFNGLLWIEKASLPTVSRQLAARWFFMLNNN